MREIQDEAYSEAMDEITRLKNEILEHGHRVKLSEYQKLQALCTRAAEALEETLPLIDQTWNHKVSARSKLIVELRKAAEEKNE